MVDPKLMRRDDAALNEAPHTTMAQLDDQYFIVEKHFRKDPGDNIMDDAYRTVYRDREGTYGSPADNMRAIAGLWNVYLGMKYGEQREWEITPIDVCAMMRLLKEARLITTPTHRDSLVDIAGYAGVQDRVIEGK